VPKVLGWGRYGSQAAAEAINDVDGHALRWWLNPFLPFAEAGKKEGSRRIEGATSLRSSPAPSGVCWRARGGSKAPGRTEKVAEYSESISAGRRVIFSVTIFKKVLIPRA